MIGLPIELGINSIGSPTLDTDLTAADPLSVTLDRAFSPNTLALLGVVVMLQSGSPSAPSISGAGISWQLHSTQRVDTSGFNQGTLFLFRGTSDAPSGTTITVTMAQGYRVALAQAIEVPGATLGGMAGEEAFAQTVGAQAENVSTVAVAMGTLSDTTNNAFLAFCALTRSAGGSPSFQTIPGFEPLGQAGGTRRSDANGVVAAIGVQYVIGDASINPTVTLTSSQAVNALAILCVELAAAPTGPTAQYIHRVTQGDASPTDATTRISADVGTEVRTYQDTTASRGQSYDYYVEAVYEGDVSVFSSPISVTIPWLPPEASVIQPVAGTVSEGMMLPLIGTATPGSGAIVVRRWSSSVDGVLGTGNELYLVLSGTDEAPVTHVLTFYVEDDNSQNDSVPVVVTIGLGEGGGTGGFDAARFAIQAMGGV